MKAWPVVQLSFLLPCVLLACSREPVICHLEKVKTLYITQGRNGDEAIDYLHYVLLKGFSKECLDSATIVTVATAYRDTVAGKRPIHMLMLYGSEEKFKPGAIPISPGVDEDRLVKIVFDNKTGKPTNFFFYNNEGNMVYWGSRWVLNKK